MLIVAVQFFEDTVYVCGRDDREISVAGSLQESRIRIQAA